MNRQCIDIRDMQKKVDDVHLSNQRMKKEVEIIQAMGHRINEIQGKLKVYHQETKLTID